jgi:hypothetical protein
MKLHHEMEDGAVNKTLLLLLIYFKLMHHVPHMFSKETKPKGESLKVKWVKNVSLPRFNTPPWLFNKLMPRSISKTQKNAIMELLKDFTSILKNASISYSMWAGTMLGSYMCHDMLPWDDDIDIMIKYEDLPKLKHAFKEKRLWHKYALQKMPFHRKDLEYEMHTLRRLPPMLRSIICIRRWRE